MGDLDVQNLRGETALHSACSEGYAHVVHLLCCGRADPRLGDALNAEVAGLLAIRRRAEFAQQVP